MKTSYKRLCPLLRIPAQAPFVALVLASTLFAISCKSTPSINPFEVADQSGYRARGDLLDAPVDPQRHTTTRRPAASDSDAIFIPAASATMSRTIDGEPNDWDLSRARTFKSRADIESGPEFWTDANDASFRLALHADENYLYFLIDVIDDNVIIRSPDQPVDAVQIWLRDPQLERMHSRLPADFPHQNLLAHDTTLTITPDGNIHSAATDPGTVTVAAQKRVNGYSLELAIPIEALPQVAAFPLPEIAFRVEVLDGDDPNRPGPQTILSMLPDTGAGTPRFALLNTELLPHLPLAETSAAANTLGAWRHSHGQWQFHQLEAISSSWHTLPDLHAVQATIPTSSELLPAICREARNDILLLDAYQSTNRQNRVALLLCGPNPTSGQCTASSRSEAVWAHLVPEGDTWTIRRAFSLFEAPLTQCGLQPAPGQPHLTQFSMTPLSAISPAFWAVGWKRATRHSHEHIDLTGITLIDAHTQIGRVGELHPERISSTAKVRTLRTSQIYFTNLDDQPGLDICEIEVTEDLDCTGFDTGCRAQPKGKNTLSLIKTWNDQTRKFEPYLFTKHPRCTPTTRFNQIDGFMLLHVNHRFALLPAPN